MFNASASEQAAEIAVWIQIAIGLWEVQTKKAEVSSPPAISVSIKLASCRNQGKVGKGYIKSYESMATVSSLADEGFIQYCSAESRNNRSIQENLWGCHGNYKTAAFLFNPS